MASLPIANKKDLKIGAAAAVLSLILLLVLLLLLSFEVADPKPEPPRIAAETEIDEMLLENLKVDMGGGSEGAPSDSPIDEPKDQTEEVITKKDNPNTKVNTGKSDKTNAAKSDNTASTTKQDDNPFGGSGGGKKGDGSGKFGDDAGAGSGSGPGGVGDGAGRIRLNDPKVDEIASDHNHVIHLRATINAEGRIVDVTNLPAKTTTSDQVILRQVIAAVKNQVRYNKKAGAGLELVYLTINLNAN
jgi:hypothetical protein